MWRSASEPKGKTEGTFVTDEQAKSPDDDESVVPEVEEPSRPEAVADTHPRHAARVTDDPRGEMLAGDVAHDADDVDYRVVDEDAEELVDADEELDDTPLSGDPEDMVVDDEQQLEAAGSTAAKARSSRPQRRSSAASPDVTNSKGRPTRKRSDATASRTTSAHRTGPIEFTSQSAAELRKVVWPTGEQLRQYFFVVLFFVLFLIAFVSSLDLFFGWGLLKLFGK